MELGETEEAAGKASKAAPPLQRDQRDRLRGARVCGVGPGGV